MNDRRDTTRREDRRQAILDAAESLFLEQGYERVSVNAIVQRSGGSLATVYDLFGNKHGLLYAVVDRARDEGLKGVEDIYAQDSRPGAILRELALRYHAFATAPRSLALMRSEEHTSELQSLMRTSYAVFCLKKKIHLYKLTC